MDIGMTLPNRGVLLGATTPEQMLNLAEAALARGWMRMCSGVEPTQAARSKFSQPDGVPHATSAHAVAMESLQSIRTAEDAGSHDGSGAGDHDCAYTFGRRPRGNTPYPFSTRQYARLLVLRSRIQADLVGCDDRRAAAPSD